jgi:hypothetical protein
MKQEILKSLLEKINAYGLHEAVRARLTEGPDTGSVQLLYSSLVAALNTELKRQQAANPKQTGLQGTIFSYNQSGVGAEGENHDIKYYLTYKKADSTSSASGGSLDDSTTRLKDYSVPNGPLGAANTLKNYVKTLPNGEKYPKLLGKNFSTAGAIAAIDAWLKPYITPVTPVPTKKP